MRALSAALLVLSACNSGPASPAAKLWTASDFLAKQGKPVDFGGWTPDELLAVEGAPLRFLGGSQVGGPGLTLFPAVADQAVAAFVITDIWANHPQPWVQPVWVPLPAGVEGVRNVFPVDVTATFYSPFWRLEWLTTEGLKADTYRSGRDVLSARPVRTSGGIVLCPLVPPTVWFADDGSGPKEPTTLRSVAYVPNGVGKLPEKMKQAWVDEQPVSYFDFGPDRAPADQQTLVEATAWFFVRTAGERPLPLAAVLPADPLHHSLVRRVDVVLPPGAAPFVPSNRPVLRALLEARDLVVPAVPASLDAFPHLALRVALDPKCFDDPTFPATCDWLDTPGRLEALPSKLRIVQPVQLAIGVVLP